MILTPAQIEARKRLKIAFLMRKYLNIEKPEVIDARLRWQMYPTKAGGNA